MAILVDFSQVFLSNLLKHVNSKYADIIEPDLVRHMVLNSIRTYKQKYSSEYGDIIIACDSKGYWRKKLFPQYKAHRKAAREKTKLDWSHIFEILDAVKYELAEYFPYPIVEVDTAEADDVIATLAKHIAPNEKVLILSGDHDFAQLQLYDNIDQYDPIRKRTVIEKDPRKALYEHILRGDAGDGIPNFLSPDNTYTDKVRSKKLYQTKIDEYLADPALYFSPDDMFEGEMKRNFQRNRMLIDLDLIPADVTDNIIAEYNRQAERPKNRTKIMTYMIKFKMKNLIATINDF